MLQTVLKLVESFSMDNLNLHTTTARINQFANFHSRSVPTLSKLTHSIKQKIFLHLAIIVSNRKRIRNAALLVILDAMVILTHPLTLQNIVELQLNATLPYLFFMHLTQNTQNHLRPHHLPFSVVSFKTF
jgi:hypothetical protein